MVFQQLMAKIYLNPERLFLIDGLGAVISAFLLGVVLVKLENVFGIPMPALCFLALMPLAFALYDFCCFISVKKNIALFLKGIAYSNLLYCCISFGLVAYHYKEITVPGWAYVLLEILIVMTLANFELRTAQLTAKKQHAGR